MAREFAREYSTLNTYVDGTYSSNPVSDYRNDFFFMREYLRIGEQNERSLIRLSGTTKPKKVMSIKLCIAFASLPNTELNARLFMYKVREPWDKFVTYNKCPIYTEPYDIGGFPNQAGIYQTYDITNLISIDELLDAGIVLMAASATTTRATGAAYSSRSANYPPYFEIEYADAPEIPQAIGPSAGANVEIVGGFGRFIWEHRASIISSLPQKGYNLQFSADGLNWTTSSATTSNQYADVPVASIPAGNFYWRVQTIDTDNVPSDYCAQQYAYRGTMPAAPSIITSVFNSSRPRLQWSTGYAQTGYRVQILLGSTSIIDATVESEDQFYDVPVALANGTQYTVRITIKDASAHYSLWAEDAVSTDYETPSIPSFIAVKKKDSVRLIITNPAGGDAVVRNDIYRLEDGEYVRIGRTTREIYDDWSAGVGTRRYKVAAVGASGEAVSDEAEIDFDLEGAYLTAVDDPEHPFEVLYNITDKNSAEHSLTLVEYAGREKPVAEFGEILQRSISVSFDSDDPGEYARLEALFRRRSVVLFRNSRTKLYGVCSNPSEQPEDFLGIAYNLSFVVSEIEHSEVV